MAGSKSDIRRRAVEPLEKFFHRVHDAGIGRLVSRQCRDGLLKFQTLHDVENPPHRLGFQKGLPAGEDIVLRQQAYEVEAELASRGFDAEGDIGHAARDVSGDSGMCELDLLRAIDLCLIDSVQCQKLIEQQARS